METYIAYFDESGDDGITIASSDAFVLTSIYMNCSDWQRNFNQIRLCREALKENYGFHISEELHTKDLLTNKKPYRDYGWTNTQKREIIISIAKCISGLSLKTINVIIDKTKFTDSNYAVLENALKYNIQRIENDSNSEWNYIIITDKGRLAPMRKTARAIRAYNPIQSKYDYSYKNQPIRNLIEDILEKDSKESYFIQTCDFVSYFVHLYYKLNYQKKSLPNRVADMIDGNFVKRTMATLKPILNLSASRNKYGLVVYPK